ncbi:MAG: hypothetical protein ACYTBJ_19360 [Planctomycetota bacterium]|jgi:hypothetical protein
MSQTKSTTIYGLAGTLETVYGDATSPSLSTDGIQLAEEFLATREYLHDGARPAPPGSAISTQKMATPGGSFFTGSPSTLGRGAGAAYSASVKPPDIATFMEMSGHSSTLVDTISYTYEPHALTVTPESGSFSAYSRGQLWPLSGVYGSLGMVVEDGGFAVFSCDMQGICGAPSDVTLPAITYSTVMHPKAEGVALTIGNYTGAVVRRLEFTQNRELANRLDQSGASLYPGTANGRMSPVLTMTVEADTFTTTPFHAASAFDPWGFYDSAQEVAITFTVGTVQFNKFTFTASQAQMNAVPVEGADGPTGLWDLSFVLNPSSAILQDAYSFLFN